MNIVFKSIRTMLKLVLALVLVLVVSVSVIKNDARVKESLRERLTPYMSYLVGGDVAFTVENISLFPLNIELGNVVSTPLEAERGQWRWTCPSLTIGCSWFDLVLYGTVALKIDMDKLAVETLLNNNGLCVWKIITRIMSGSPSVPVFLEELSVTHGHLQINEPLSDVHATLDYSLQLLKISTLLKGSLTVHDAQGNIHGRQAFEKLKGPIVFDSSYRLNKLRLYISADCSLDLPQLSDKTCRLTGLWNYDTGNVFVKNESGSCVVGPIALSSTPAGLTCDATAQLPLSYLYSLATNDMRPSPITGQCTVHGEVATAASGLQVAVDVSAQSVCYAHTTLLTTGTLSCTRDHGLWDGTVTAQLDGVTSLAGTVQWDEQSAAGLCHLNNDQQVTFPGVANWCFLPKTVVIECARSTDGSMNGSLQCVAHNKKTGSQIACSTQASLVKDLLDVHGVIDNKSLMLTCSVGKQPSLRQCTCSDSNGKKLIDIHARLNHPEHFVATVSLGFVKEMLKRALDVDFQGQGTLECAGMVQNKKLYTQLKLIDGSVRLPYTYNLINGLTGRCVIDLGERVVDFRDIHCSLYRGTLDCQSARLAFDHTYVPTLVHVPCVLHDCLLNWKNDLFAIISGDVVFQKIAGAQPTFSGHLVIDRAQLKRNIFSEEFQKSFFGSSGSQFLPKKGPSIGLDVHVATQNPIRVKTSFLETSARLDLAVKGSLKQPDIAGKIALVSGALHFPYKPLYITKGYIEFTSGHVNDPYIEMSAKNKLKKYNVNLDISGSLNDPHIFLEASPSLTEEQIVALLLVGSEQGSLNIVMPALIMQNVKNIIFGSDQSPTGIRKAFGHLFKPLERVHLVPSFTDQTGRGGLRAAVEIDVSDRWRATIQKNFSLTEDTKVELDYAVSDDVNLRGVRDERGDVSAEVEMRWKF